MSPSSGTRMNKMVLVRGFILHKLYRLGYVGARHTAVENLRKSCPPEFRVILSDAVKELRREGLLIIKPTSYGDQVSTVKEQRGYDYANSYEDYAGLPRLTFAGPKKQPKVQPLTTEQLQQLKKAWR